MFTRFTWAGVAVCAAVSFAGSSSYASGINFGSCSQIVQPALPTPPVNCPNGDAGTSTISYSDGVVSVTASGYLNAGAAEHLYVKNSATPGETGLGTIIDTADHEITDKDFVNLDLSNLLAHGITSAQLTIESLQASENFSLCQGAAVGVFGTLNCQSGGGGSLIKTVTITFNSTNDILSIQGIQQPGSPIVLGPDVLVQGLTFTTPSQTPEPASMLLFGTGIASIILKRRRRSGNKQPATV